MKQRPKYIIMIGPQASGKGTYSKAIVEKYGVVHISSGQLLRDNIKNETRLGKKAKPYIDAGNLVPDKIIIKIIKKRLKEKDAKDGAVFDGFPRTLSQARSIIKYVGVSAVVYANISDEIVFERAAGRLTCENCGSISGVKYIKQGQKCACGGEYKVREDDTKEVIARRLANFHEITKPVVRFFERVIDAQGQKIFIEIDATGSIESVNKNVLASLEKLFNYSKKEAKKAGKVTDGTN